MPLDKDTAPIVQDALALLSSKVYSVDFDLMAVQGMSNFKFWCFRFVVIEKDLLTVSNSKSSGDHILGLLFLHKILTV